MEMLFIIIFIVILVVIIANLGQYSEQVRTERREAETEYIGRVGEETTEAIVSRIKEYIHFRFKFVSNPFQFRFKSVSFPFQKWYQGRCCEEQSNGLLDTVSKILLNIRDFIFATSAYFSNFVNGAVVGVAGVARFLG